MTCEIPYDQLAAYVAGDAADLPPGVNLAAHVAACPRCQHRLAALRAADSALAATPKLRPDARAAIKAWRTASAQAAPREADKEILTLDEVAEFLRVSLQDMDEIADELPAFELAGQLRVRRMRLIEWIAQRERDYSRNAAASSMARILNPSAE